MVTLDALKLHLSLRNTGMSKHLVSTTNGLTFRASPAPQHGLGAGQEHDYIATCSLPLLRAAWRTSLSPD